MIHNPNPFPLHSLGIWVAHYLRSYILQDPASRSLIFGDGPDSLLKVTGMADHRSSYTNPKAEAAKTHTHS